MRVRQLYGTRAGEFVEMPYHIAVRAIASGTVDLGEPARPVGDTPAPVVPAAKRPNRPTTRR